jgi:nicotinate-nucleotide adenylyltransferase
MQIGLFPGSFNPIHLGHLIIAQYFLNEYPIDQIWFIISPQNPLKKRSGLAEFHHRLRMVELSLGSNSQMVASGIESQLPLPSYTIHTLDHLKSHYPEHDFSLILGMDNYEQFNLWKSHDRIIQENKIFLYPRKGSLVPVSPSPHFIITQAPEIEISSTRIRKILLENKNIQFLVAEPVLKYIQEHHLYQK